MISAALNGKLNDVKFETHAIFGMMMPKTCPNVPDGLLNPRCTWTNKEDYDKQAKNLAKLFAMNFEKYAASVTNSILNAAPLAD